MGISNSKTEPCEPLRLCKERKKFMKQAIDSRYSLAASHVVYIQSLHNLGNILVKLADTEVLLESSTPPFPTHINNSTLNCMKSVEVSSITVNINPSTINNKVYVDDIESSPLTMSPSPSPSPPPPPPPPRFSWDYFDPTDGSFRLMARDRLLSSPELVKHDGNGDSEAIVDDSVCGSGQMEQCGSNSKDGCVTEVTRDDTEVMCHRSKGFVCRMKEVGDLFVRGSKSGNDVSRMLEVNQIQISYSEVNGGLSRSTSSLLTCFRGENSLILHEPQQTAKLITWKRSMSTNSSLLRLPGPPSTNDNENNFIEEFCMIAGSHSSTLDRLYAWERKLYDEVKASESIRKEYEKKCDELRHQFTKDLKPHLIDKTRALAKDLHSRMKVALHTVNSISKRIEKMRDEELQPQLMELIQGLMRMWKSMLECHHSQYITSNHSKNSRTQTGTMNPMIMAELEHEVERFGSSFSDLVKSYTSYVESINNWLQKCITQPKERVKGRRAFSPRRAVAPPIFIMCRDWSAGIQTLHSQNVSDVIKELLCHIRRLSLSMEEEMKNKEMSLIDNGLEKKIEGWDLSMIEACLTKVFDRLTSYCEESWNMYEEIKDKGETAGNLYLNYRPPLRPPSVI